MGLRAPELIIILIVALLIFGPKNLPKLGKSLGQTVKNVREGMEGDEDEPKKVEEAAAEPAPAPEATVAPVEDVVEEDVVFCSKCGAKNAADAAFCSKCGEKLA
ncbi:MAG: twin-arginine translocase TatA/TatE family subunit [Atopobiaceae bacterium]|nr:twin-arginine translocase TatA/TatE family subunit [Atopobiaceae bacterium]